MKIEKNENLALLIGFILIVLVIIITLMRGNLFSKKDSSANKNTSSADTSSAQKNPNINATGLNKKIMLAGKTLDFTMLDVRPFESYAQEHILDSINIPLDEFPVGSKIDTRKPIFLISANDADKDTAIALSKLKDEKIENVTVLAGGMDSWKKFIGATVSYGDPNSFVDQSKVSYVDPASLNDSIVKKIPVFIVDVRDKADFDKGHLLGAINIPFNELEQRRSEVLQKIIIVVGTDELQEFQASVQLHDMLLVSPFVMRGAMPKWEELKFELVK